MEKILKQSGVATLENFSVGKGSVVKLKFKFRYDEIVTSVSLLQAVNTDVTLVAKVDNKDIKNLGLFVIDAVNFDKDRNATAVFKSLTDNVNLNYICDIVDANLIQLGIKAVIEIEEKEGE